jgi:hypothetical protein
MAKAPLYRLPEDGDDALMPQHKPENHIGFHRLLTRSGLAAFHPKMPWRHEAAV